MRWTAPWVLWAALLASQGDQRAPVPAPADQERSGKLIREVFKEEYAKKSSADQKALARKLLQQGIDTKEDAASRYVLFREAREIAEKVGELETAMAAISEAAKYFEIDGTALKAKTLGEMAAGAKSPEAAGAIADACLNVIDEAVREEKFDAARSLILKVESAVKAVKDVDRTTEVQRRGKEIGDLAREYQKAKEAARKLETNADDRGANAVVGKFLCLVKKEWEKGLPMLAKGSDPGLKTLAELELANPADAAAQAALGEAWAAQAEKETGVYKGPARGRASEWLGRAIPGLTGLAKVSAERKLAALGPATAPKSRLVLDLGDGVRMEMVYIRPGTFTMGGTVAPGDWPEDERPEHRVTITKGYYLGKCEVTRGQFAVFVRATAYKTEAEREGDARVLSPEGRFETIRGSNWRTPSSFTQSDEHPVVCVSWNDAIAFCEWATKKTGREVRLPTEAEWEYACRAGTTTRWSFGDDESRAEDYGWFKTNSKTQTNPVGRKKPNAWGLYDMHGNLWEWIHDWYAPYGGDATDPEGPMNGDRRCLRGGMWNGDPIYCRSAIRHARPSNLRSTACGFRACLR